MCGIGGIWNDLAGDDALARVGNMLDAMRHRGPDGRGTLQYAGGAAGMVRLALVDLSDRGQQPMWSEDRRVAILFNGEVYNFREQRERLEKKGYRFHSGTDTEVVLVLYLEHGAAFVNHLRGMYGLAIFDFRERGPDAVPTLLLARGPLGIKPVYVAHPAGNPGGIVFASELRGVLASDRVPAEVDREGLVDFLSCGFLLQPRTMISGVRMMEPGTLETYRPGHPMERTRFWRVPDYAPRQETLDQAAERLRVVLDESVRLHALADAPVGAFLSGGIDSTGIVGLMSKHVPNLRTYSLRFPDLPGGDEFEEAAAAARRFNCHNTVVDVTGPEIAGLLAAFAAQLDQPSTDGLNTWVISKAAARDVKGVLSGVGGDEWFAGYPVTRRMARYTSTLKGRLLSVGGGLAQQVEPLLPRGPLRKRFANLATRRSPLATWAHGHSVFDFATARRFAGLGPERLDEETRFAVALADSSNWRDESAVGLSCLLDTRIYMIDQLLRDSDSTSMAHSLELRVPFVDVEVAAFSRSCQDEYKLSSSGGANGQYASSGAKRVLIHALRDVLPEGIDRRPKRGFELPFAGWMRGPLKSLVEETCSPQTLRERGLVDPDELARWQSQRPAGDESLFPHKWSLMILELWCRSMLDARSPAPAHP